MQSRRLSNSERGDCPLIGTHGARWDDGLAETAWVMATLVGGRWLQRSVNRGQYFRPC